MKKLFLFLVPFCANLQLSASNGYTLKKDNVDFNSTASYNISSNTIKQLSDPVHTAKQTWRDVEVVMEMGKNVGTALSTKGLTISEKIQAAKAGMQNAADPANANIKNKTAQKLNTATEKSAEQLKTTLEDLVNQTSNYQKVNLDLYQGNDPSLQNHKLSGDAAAYIIGQDKILINTQCTNLEKGSDIARSLAHETARHKMHTGEYKISAANETKFATVVGKMAESTWKSIHGDNAKPRVSADDWNVRNRDVLGENSRRLAGVDEGDVRERFAEHLFPSYKKAIKEGDYEKAAKIKQRCDIGETVFAALVAGKAGVAALAAYDLAESAIDISKDIKDKNYKSALNTVGTIGLESALSYGAGKALGKLATTVGKMPVVQNMVNKAKNIFIKETVQSEVKAMEQVLKTEMEILGNSINSPAHLSINAERLAKQLASESQMLESGTSIIKKLYSAPRLVELYGGKNTDWLKKSSSLFTKNGKSFETHWYENAVTGKRVEFKTKLLK